MKGLEGAEVGVQGHRYDPDADDLGHVERSLVLGIHTVEWMRRVIGSMDVSERGQLPGTLSIKGAALGDLKRYEERLRESLNRLRGEAP